MDHDRVRRKCDEARTPFECLCETGTLAPETVERLEQLRRQTNPRTLRHWIREESAAILSALCQPQIIVCRYSVAIAGGRASPSGISQRAFGSMYAPSGVTIDTNRPPRPSPRVRVAFSPLVAPYRAFATLTCCAPILSWPTGGSCRRRT